MSVTPHKKMQESVNINQDIFSPFYALWHSGCRISDDFCVFRNASIVIFVPLCKLNVWISFVPILLFHYISEYNILQSLAASRKWQWHSGCFGSVWSEVRVWQIKESRRYINTVWRNCRFHCGYEFFCIRFAKQHCKDDCNSICIIIMCLRSAYKTKPVVEFICK